MALVISLLMTIVVMGLVVSGTLSERAHRTDVEIDFARHAQATQLARSGITESLGWFRKQSTQPVTAFDPVLDFTVNPPILDTDDPEIGIVRDFKITGTVWGRYEVWKEWAADPDPERLLWRQKTEVADISESRGTTPGGAWRLRSAGYVYQRRDGAKRFDEYPNHVIAGTILDADIRRLMISPPGQAAINIRRGANLTVNTMGRVFGGSTGAGVYYPQGTGTPQPNPLSATRVTGTPQFAATSSGYDDSIEAVFGVSRSEFLALADDVVTNMAYFPVPVPAYSIVAVQSPSVKFDATTPLKSTAAVVYIEGNTTLMPGSLSSFSGLLFVDGNLTVREPCEIRGTIIVTGNMTVQGSSDWADVYFDDAILNELRLNIGNYRLSSAFRKPEIK